MKVFGLISAVVVAAMALAVPAAAQFGGSGALGGPFLSRGVSRPLGGIENPPQPSAQRRGNVPARRGPGYATPFAYAVYVPSYFEYAVDPSYAPMVMTPQPAPAAPPVIINQYFGQS